MSLTKQQRFLRDLSKLSEKYELYIGGCGCMGSPYIFDLKSKVVLVELNHTEWEYRARDNETKKVVR